MAKSMVLLHGVAGVAGQPDDEEADRLDAGRLGIAEGLADRIVIDVLVDAHDHLRVARFDAKGGAFHARRLQLQQQIVVDKIRTDAVDEDPGHMV